VTQDSILSISEIGGNGQPSKRGTLKAPIIYWIFRSTQTVRNIFLLISKFNFAIVFSKSIISSVPYYPSSNEECDITNDIDDMGLSAKPAQKIRINYTGGEIVYAIQSYFMNKMRAVVRFRFMIKNIFGVTPAADTFDVELILPDHCEISDKSKTPLYMEFQRLIGFAGAHCTVQYAQNGPVVGTVQPDIKPYLTFNDPATTKMVFKFIFPPFEYYSVINGCDWEFRVINGVSLSPWVGPVVLELVAGNPRQLGSTQPRGRFTLMNMDSGRDYEINIDSLGTRVRMDLS
jgi:hypothetical protein